MENFVPKDLYIIMRRLLFLMQHYVDKNFTVNKIIFVGWQKWYSITSSQWMVTDAHNIFMSD